MNAASSEYLKKTVFWQRFAMVVLSLFLVLMWGITIYYFTDWIGFNWRAKLEREEFYFFLVFFAYLGAGTYIDYVLYEAAAALDMIQLELAFRKQRHFWMGLTLMVLSVFALGFLLLIIFSGGAIR